MDFALFCNGKLAVLAISQEIRIFPRTVGNTGKYGKYVLT